MNAIAPVEAAIGDAAWGQAIRSVNEWRGHALHCFAQAEAAVSETLLVMAAVPERGARVKLRRLIGQRFEDLNSAIEAQGPFGAEAGKAVQALFAFREQEALRPILCHGTAKVALDRHGQWLIQIKVVSFRARKADRTSLALDEREAGARLAELKERTHHLVSALRLLRRRISD
ncbi:MAG TPA: hypothetical protein VEW04_00215 [Allosphingosinicella sp.]|nr:hypothetical protein [Allosphingosinicella sp.]